MLCVVLYVLCCVVCCFVGFVVVQLCRIDLQLAGDGFLERAARLVDAGNAQPLQRGARLHVRNAAHYLLPSLLLMCHSNVSLDFYNLTTKGFECQTLYGTRLHAPCPLLYYFIKQCFKQ